MLFTKLNIILIFFINNIYFPQCINKPGNDNIYSKLVDIIQQFTTKMLY